MDWQDEPLLGRLGREWRKKDLVAKVAELNCPHPGVYVKSTKETWFSCLRNRRRGQQQRHPSASVEEAGSQLAGALPGLGRPLLKPKPIGWRERLAAEFDDKGICSRCKDPKTIERQMRACTDLKTQIQHFRNKHSNYPMEMADTAVQIAERADATAQRAEAIADEAMKMAGRADSKGERAIQANVDLRKELVRVGVLPAAADESKVPAPVSAVQTDPDVSEAPLLPELLTEQIPPRMGIPNISISLFPSELLLNGKRSLVASSSLRPSNASLSIFNVRTGDVRGSSRFLASSSQGNDSDYNPRTSPANIPPPPETQQSQRKRRYVHPAAQQCPSDDLTRERMITQTPLIPKKLRHGEPQLMELVEGLRWEVDALFEICCECPVMVTGKWHYCDARNCSAGRTSELPVDLDPPPCGARQFTQHYTKDLVDLMGSDDQGEMSEQTIGWLKKLCQRIYVVFVHFEKYHYGRFTRFEGETRLCRLFHVFVLDNGLMRPEELTVRLVQDTQTPFHTITADTLMNPSRRLTFSDV
ncbi:hypothetical protein BV898_02865 [Hypsibius exemplaris]|uniref:Uncharacterized protein n=1 Tax=Hypsibius exemplaris TaxID=2072580 RepID=A0A1W0X6E4_HYPEX|nr:hypothetical protein BV898_02865 [Hypsibius exemplaris]